MNTPNDPAYAMPTDKAHNADLFADPPGGYNDMPWQMRRFVDSITSNMQRWQYVAPIEDQDDD